MNFAASVTQVFGILLTSRYPLAGLTANTPTDGLEDEHAPRLHFECHSQPPFQVDWAEGRPAYVHVYQTEDGEKKTAIYRFADFDLLHLPDFADFYIGRERIDCHLLDESASAWVEIYLLGTILAFWLERAGMPVLHASAVVSAGRTAAFMGHSGRGKSTLAAAFLKDGGALLTDDNLALERRKESFWGRPGPARVNLLPVLAREWLGAVGDLERVLPQEPKVRLPVGKNGVGAYCGTKAEIDCIYLVNRRDPQVHGQVISIQPVSPAEAVIELMRYSYLSEIVEEMGWQPARLDFFASLVQSVPVRRVSYPNGFEYLPEVTAALRRDLEILSERVPAG